MSSAGLRLAILLTIIIATATAISLKAKASTGTRLNCAGNVCKPDENCIWQIQTTCRRFSHCSTDGKYVCQSPCLTTPCDYGENCKATEENGKLVGKCVNPCDTSNCKALGLTCEVELYALDTAVASCVYPPEWKQAIGSVQRIVSGIAQKLRDFKDPLPV